MRSLTKLARILAISPLTMACGGTVGPVDPGSLHIEGSYDISVDGFSVTPGPYQPNPPPPTHPAVNAHARLDIRKNAGQLEAVVTPDFGEPTAMTVAISRDGAVLLSGDLGFVAGTYEYQSTTDRLRAIAMTVGSDGHLTGSWTATGEEDVFEGDVGWNNDATATGSLAGDARAPTTTASPMPSADSQMLPWDGYSVRISEPVDAIALKHAVSLSLGSGGAAMSFSMPTSAPTDWAGIVTVSALRTSWDFASSGTLQVAGGLVDPSGNASTSTSKAATYLAVPTATAFGKSTAPAMWGAASTTTDGFSIGPVLGPCNAAPAGVAGRFDATSATKLKLVYRVRSVQGYAGGGVGVTVATPGNVAVPLSDPQLVPELAPSSDPDYPFATVWVTAIVALPVTGSDLGFAITAFNDSFSSCGGWGMPNGTIVVDVSEVSVLP